MSSSFPGRFQNLQKLTAQCHLATRSVRQLSTTSSRPYPRKDAQDRESIDTNATEYSKSGSDDMAAHKDVAFEPGRTKPDEALDKAEKESNGNPLDVSPANHDVSKPRSGTEGGPEASAGESGQQSRPASGGGSPSKGKKIT